MTLAKSQPFEIPAPTPETAASTVSDRRGAATVWAGTEDLDPMTQVAERECLYQVLESSAAESGEVVRHIIEASSM